MPDQLFSAGQSLAVPSAGLLTGTGASYSTTVAVAAVVKGVYGIPLAPQLNTALPSVDGVTGLPFKGLVGGASVAGVPGQGCTFLYCVNAAGVLAVVQGPIVTLDLQDNFTWNQSQFGPIPDGYSPFAYQIIKAGAAASATPWVFGTGTWASTGITSSIKNLAYLPDRPRVA